MTQHEFCTSMLESLNRGITQKRVEIRRRITQQTTKCNAHTHPFLFIFNHNDYALTKKRVFLLFFPCIKLQLMHKILAIHDF